MAVDILLQSYKFLDKLVRTSPRNSIKLNVPETLILGDDSPISYLYTNELGYLECETMNMEEDSESSQSSHSRTQKPYADFSHQSIQGETIVRVAQIADYFFDKAYVERDLKHGKLQLKDSF